MKTMSLVFILMFSVLAHANGGLDMATAQEVIEKLDLKPLPEEGGYYRETFKSPGRDLPASTFGINSSGTRSPSTAIYYLVTPESFSALHRVQSDEVFHFYGGDPVEMVQIDESGRVQYFTLGSDIFKDESPQVVVPRGVWQALRLKKGGAWALMGTTVAPGFEFEDFELGTREMMLEKYPELRKDILNYTRGENEKVK